MPEGFAKPGDAPLPKPYWVAGYRINNPARGVLDPMEAAAVWLSPGTGEGIFLLSIDSVGMSSPDCEALYAPMQAELTAWGCKDLFVCSTHNHAGIDTLGYWGKLPKSGRDNAFMENLFACCRSAMRQAYANRKPGKLYYGSCPAPDVFRDTRLPEALPRILDRFRFVPADGTAETWLCREDSHAESLLGKNSFVSADFPGYLRRRVKAQTGAQAVCFTGAEGGQIRPQDLDPDNVESTRLCGERLADAYMAITDGEALPAELTYLRRQFVLPCENLMLSVAAWAKLFKAKLAPCSEAAVGYGVLTEMTYFRIGGKALVALPGEIFPELAYTGKRLGDPARPDFYLQAEESAAGEGPEANPRPLAELAGGQDLMVIGLCNDMTGYVVPPNDWFLGPDGYFNGGRDRLGRRHYEETNSLGPATARVIARAFEDIVHALPDSADKQTARPTTEE
jgi:hypothetical protein